MRTIQANFINGGVALAARAGQLGGAPGVAQARGRSGAAGVIPLDANRLNLAGSVGRPLPSAVQMKMESFFSADFSQVRVHVGTQAQSIGAHAFTTGNNIYFAPGRYAPDTPQGQQLLGHELAHVIQQREGRVHAPAGGGMVVVNNKALEAEADRLGARAAAFVPPLATPPKSAQMKSAHAAAAPAQPARTSAQPKLAPGAVRSASAQPKPAPSGRISSVQPKLVSAAPPRSGSAGPQPALARTAGSVAAPAGAATRLPLPAAARQDARPAQAKLAPQASRYQPQWAAGQGMVAQPFFGAIGNALSTAATTTRNMVTGGASAAYNRGATIVNNSRNAIVGAGTTVYNQGSALVTGTRNVIVGAGTSAYNRSVAMVGTIRNTAVTAGNHMYAAGVWGINQSGRQASNVSYYLPGAPEWLKEYADPRRNRYNPYWRRASTANLAYEAVHGGVGYHSVARHGEQHTMDNVRARLMPAPGPGGLSHMTDQHGAQVRRATTSSRFATGAWHRYTRDKAKQHFEASVVNPMGGAWNWPVALVPPSAPNGGATYYPNTAQICVTYSDNVVGFSLDPAHQHGERARSTQSLIGYDNAGNAYVCQHYPVTAPFVPQQRVGIPPPPAPQPPAAAFPAGATVVAYADVPWF